MLNLREIFNRDLIFIKNAVRAREAKMADKLDVYDPETRQVLLECREPDLGALTKMARLAGGRHDKGTAFDLVASLPGGGQQVLRVARANATLSLGGPPVRIYDDSNTPVGTLKEKLFAIGLRYNFVPEKQEKPFVLHIEGKFPRNGCDIFCDGKQVAGISQPRTEVFKEGQFDYAFSIDREVPPDSVMRQVLLAVGLAKHRLIS
jgi:hypothetical protein